MKRVKEWLRQRSKSASARIGLLDGIYVGASELIAQKQSDVLQSGVEIPGCLIHRYLKPLPALKSPVQCTIFALVQS